MIQRYSANNVREAIVRLTNKPGKKWKYDRPEDEGKPAFERCIENPWTLDKISSIDKDLSGAKMFDFGCNKARYVQAAKKLHNLKTYGIDAKPEGKRYVDHFFEGQYDDALERKIIREGPYAIATSISSVEHAGHDLHPNEGAIRRYQYRICKMMIENSEYFFLTVPFGKRPGWAKDESRKNLYQFNPEMLDYIKAVADAEGKNYLEEVYKLEGDKWVISDRDAAADCRYRGNKLGATAIALVSVWSEDE